MIDRTERVAQAQTILGMPLFNVIMDELEAAEINGALAAEYTNHEKRQGHMAALKAIKRVRQDIKNLAADGQQSGGRKAPA